MLIAGYVFAALAAAVHVYIFWLEALAFERGGRKVFGVSAEHAAIVKAWAYNQGFYNLFLAVGIAVGLVLVDSNRDAAIALLVFGTGSMVAAATVLITTDRSQARGALVQGLFPLISLTSLLIWSLG